MRALVVLAMALLVAACDREPPADGRIRVSDALGGTAEDTAGYARATSPRDFDFPADHGPHPDFKHEWWYFTGNLEAPDGRAFGYQVTFFRIALAPTMPERESRWGARQVWMGHLALTDVAAGRHRAAERIVRDALNLAGGRAAAERLWIEDWQLVRDPASGHWRIDARADDFALDLELRPLREPVLQGDEGLSQKGREPGNASYYYSLTRLATTGRVRAGDDWHEVSGLSWLDREWSTSALESDQAGWDWFSLQLADGSDIMYYRLRQADGSPDPHSRGSLVRPDGSRVELGPDTVDLTPTDWWQAAGGDRYPVAWRLELAALDQPLAVRAVLKEQLMDLSVRYWEGAVRAYGPGDELVGKGYLEMTGYGD